MAGIQASVAYSKELSRGQTAAHNEGFSVFGTQNYVFGRKPEYWVYIYNLSEQDFEVSRPPLFADLKLKGREPKEDYRFVGKLPQPLLLPKGNVDSNEVDIISQDTRRFVMDMINPDNWGINQDTFIEKSTSGGSNDLGAKGVFWSLNGPGASDNGYEEAPTAAELKSARTRMEKRYRMLLEKAKAIEVSSPKDLPDFLSPELHFAADYYQEQFSWHSKQVRSDYCPLCGERIRAGAKFHNMESGGMCILDWDAVIRAGLRTRAQALEATGDPKYEPRVPVASPTVSPTGTSTGTPKNSALPSKPPVSEANI